ncbi:MAG: glycosyltransferase [Nanoarchaeota archaeon]|nr:glycosyltransferase [Nanoarchaeota archaeon]MBU1322170.1 glycosyltransferase [Nanoarchaeota archaeon]MBU1597711.1 glycosyltransferase [Nanoarchaeota archaeon]MBU2442189.1 glycosyltransferase [Nanoarchaeota archaeon]
MKPAWILYIGTFPPRECGIATFTKDLATAMDKQFSPLIKSKILAMNDDSTNIYNYPKDVILEISDTDISEYIETAKMINKMDAVKMVSIQHEFGIFGGEYGSYLIAFLEILEKPVFITFHCVLPNPDDKLKKVVYSLAEKSESIIVMTKKGIDILRNDYGIKTDIKLIPHGIPSVAFNSSQKEKTRLSYKNRIILSSFGMMNFNKGYEYVIDALPKVVEKFPNVLYLIVGETHPIVRKKEGEQYRNFLESKVKELSLQKHVKFYNKYVKLSEIIRYLEATDIYMCSNNNPNQITSGTLAYALGVGRAVISTPFLHAKDIITPERGILVNFKDKDSFSDAILKILSDPALKEQMGKNAYSYTRHMTWPNVALSYMDLFNKYLNITDKYEKSFPKIKLNHLIRLTDDFGIFQFVNYTRPDKTDGYTLDDNARAMIVCCMHYNKFRNDIQLQHIKTYLNFIKYVQQDGRLFNFVDNNRKINIEHWTDDAHGRALWALGFLTSIKSIPQELKDEAEQVFKKSLDIANKIKSPRSVAFMILGLYFYNKAKPSSEVVANIKMLADHLINIYSDNSSDEWQWFETYLTYSNSKLPESLFYAYLATKDKKYLYIAKLTLNFLISITFENNRFAPIGHDGWYIKGGQKSHFDQQPVDTASMVQTLILAKEVTGEEKYMKNAITAFQWFLGNNILKQMVYDEQTGGCHDGVGKSSVNLNQGAESTISYLIARLTLLGS